MITTFADPFDALFSLQRELEARLASDWLHDLTTSRGPFPPINVFQEGDNILAIMELPASTRTTCKSKPKKTPFAFPARRMRVSGEFDRTLSLPVEIDPNGIKAEYRDGLIALLLPRAESDKPRSIEIK
jgi:HSP20 family protein